jgi:hypothetical protein
MFKSCFFANKPKDGVVHPIKPISAIEAQRDSLKALEEQQRVHTEFLNKVVIPQIWQKIREAKAKGYYTCGFDDNEFGTDFDCNITNEDYMLILQYFQNSKYEFMVDKVYYYKPTRIVHRPAHFRVSIYWDARLEANVLIPNEVENK